MGEWRWSDWKAGLLGLAAALLVTAAHAQVSFPLLTWNGADKDVLATFHAGGMVLKVSRRQGDDDPQPVLDVMAPGAPPLHIVTKADASFGGSLGVYRLDPLVSGPQVLFMTNTGGAHCCSDVIFAELNHGRWRVLKIGTFEGYPPKRLTDLDGDGQPEIAFPDPRFFYALDCYACSGAPPQIFAIRAGKQIDVSKERRFWPIVRKQLRSDRKQCLDHLNGFCASFVAEAAILGEGRRAWATMLRNYDPTNKAMLPRPCDVPRDGRYACPDGHEHPFAGFPEALDWFLFQTGYIKQRHALSTPR